MVMLQNEQLFILKQLTDRMLELLKGYDLFASAKFRHTLQIISSNVEQCIKHDFDGIEVLSRYVYEDWRNVCVGKNGIENWYFNIDDLELRGEINRTFEEVAVAVERILGTNFIVPRKWYSYEELISLGKNYKMRKKDWDTAINNLLRTNRYYTSPTKLIPNDIWSFAKMLCIAETDDSLEEWFGKDIPAFGFISPERILKIENGDDILRNFMYDIPT